MGKSTQIINIVRYNKYGSDKLKQRRTFYKNFNLEEEKIIKEYFVNLNNNISLTKKETIKINEDFEKAIEYYLKNGKSLKETLKILSIV